MNIGIDARLIEETGVGRYIRNLIQQLASLDSENTYVIFLRKKSFNSFVLPNSRWRKVLAEVAWHTISEQLVMPRLFGEAKLDLVHIPYHNPPIFYLGAMVITIHDLTILHFNTGKATTLPPFIYALKRLGYWVELAVGLRLAKAVIAVSETTKEELVTHFAVPKSKIHVTYEGVDAKLTNRAKNSKDVIKPEHGYFLYVGNAYPHKNLDTLMAGFAKYKGTNKLILVGAEDYFYRRLKQLVVSLGLSDRVEFFGSANDAELHKLYRGADALVFPSLMEGFGLPALEALALGTRVLCSDIPIFHEILKDRATYMDSTNADAVANALSTISEKKITPFDAKELSVYSWEHMASVTKKIYESSTRL